MRKLTTEIWVDDWLHVRTIARYAQRLDAQSALPMLRRLSIRHVLTGSNFALILEYWEGVDHMRTEFFESRLIGFREGLEAHSTGECSSMGKIEAAWLAPKDIQRPEAPGEIVIVKEPIAQGFMRRELGLAFAELAQEPNTSVLKLGESPLRPYLAAPSDVSEYRTPLADMEAVIREHRKKGLDLAKPGAERTAYTLTDQDGKLVEVDDAESLAAFRASQTSTEGQQ